MHAPFLLHIKWFAESICFCLRSCVLFCFFLCLWLFSYLCAHWIEIDIGRDLAVRIKTCICIPRLRILGMPYAIYVLYYYQKGGGSSRSQRVNAQLHILLMIGQVQYTRHRHYEWIIGQATEQNKYGWNWYDINMLIWCTKTELCVGASECPHVFPQHLKEYFAHFSVDCSGVSRETMSESRIMAESIQMLDSRSPFLPNDFWFLRKNNNNSNNKSWEMKLSEIGAKG